MGSPVRLAGASAGRLFAAGADGGHGTRAAGTARPRVARRGPRAEDLVTEARPPRRLWIVVVRGRAAAGEQRASASGHPRRRAHPLSGERRTTALRGRISVLVRQQELVARRAAARHGGL